MTKFFSSFDFRVEPLSVSERSSISKTSTQKIRGLHGLLGRKATHQWTREQRTILCILDRWFVSSEKPNNQTQTIRDIRKAFIAYFYDNCDETTQISLTGLSIGAIQSQLREIWADGPENSIWNSVFVETDFADTRCYWTATKMDIIAVIQERGIPLITRRFEDKLDIFRKTDTSIGRRKRPQREDDYMNYSSMPKRFCPMSNCQPDPPPSPTDQDNESKGLPFQNIPQVVFRGWDRKSNGVNTVNGFLAGAYLTKSLTSPPDYDSDLFKTCAIIHLSPLPKPSSFISCAQFMLRPLHRGLHSQDNAYVSIIDLCHIDRNLDIHPRLFYARDLVDQFQIKGINQTTGETYYYSGSHEWLVWSHINKESVLASFSVDAFRQYSMSHPKLRKILRLVGFEKSRSAKEYTKHITKSKVLMNQGSGKAVGHWLAWAELPAVNLNDVARSIAQAWRFEGNRILQQEEGYLKGVHAGYESFSR